MSASDQLLPTISALVALGEFGAEFAQTDPENAAETVTDELTSEARQQRAEHEWQGAIAALGQLLTQQINAPAQTKSDKTKSGKRNKKSSRSQSARNKGPQALVISGPVPLLNEPALQPKLSNWAFVPSSSENFTAAFSALSPVERMIKKTKKTFGYKQDHVPRLLPLLEDDPLSQEQFACVFTPDFSIVVVLGQDADGELSFQFSFMPQVVNSVWRMLRSRIMMIRPQQLEFVETLVEKFAPK